ncbi:phage tail length tape measure family protein [Lichenifustis flavocetrariae]|uniref:Phage tail length tape measure family protein n=1 Tax=Lichenifustis flavocetrariae TaxID=2949735 RepID=A0AA42CNW8_9HYPH|nr:phage tail length tape measure family protein [Lichenifustis flavocetrariae]MCW6509827.1 phage tail length tape measure family protein [Lichenifustis flavocetrariae]
MDDVISRVQVDYVSTGADKVAADYNRVAQAEANLARTSTGTASVTDSLSRSTLSAQRALESYTRSHDPLSRALADLARGERLAAAARAQGIASTDAHSRALENARKRVAELKDEVEKHSASMGLNRNQTMELTHVAKSLVDQLAAGASPMRALEVEGGRIAQVFAEDKGGVTGTFKALGAMIGGLLTPTVLLTGAVGGLAIAGGAAFLAYESGEAKLATSMDGVGRRAGETIAKLNDLAEAGARVGHLTTSQAIGLAADYTKVGIGSDTTASLIGSTKAYARATGSDVDEAAKSLAQAFADPAKGALDLDKQLGFLDGQLKTTIDNYEQQGNLAAARRVLADALNKSLAQTTDVTWGFSHALEDAKNWLVDGFSKAGKAIEGAVFGGTLQDQLQFYKNQLPTTSSALPGNFNTENVERRIADLERRLTEEANAPARAAAAKREADANDLSQRADGIVRDVLPEIVRAQTTANNLVVLSHALSDPLVLSKLGVTVGQAQHAFGNLTVQQSTADPLKAMAEDSRLAVQSIEAFTLAERVAVEARRAEITVLRESGDVRKAALAAEIARNEEIAKANNAAQDRLDQARQDRALVGLSPYARGRQEIVNQYQGVGGLFAKDGATSTELRDAMKPVAADLESAADTIAAALRRGAAAITAAVNPYGSIPAFKSANDNGSTLGALGRAPASIFPMISDAADRTGIDPSIIAAIGERENGFRLTGGTSTVGPDGRPASTAWGYGQLTNGAVKDVASVVPGFNKYDPSTAVFGSAEYLSILARRNGGDMTAALNAYGGTPSYAADIEKRAGSPLTVNGGGTVAPIASTALASDKQAMQTQLSGYDEEHYAGPLKAANQALDNQIALLDRQKATLGESAAKVQGAAEAQRLMNQYVNEGVPITDKLRAEIAAYGDRVATVAQQTADFQAQQQRLIASMDMVRSTARDGLGTLVDDLIKGKSAGEAFADVLEHIMQKLLSMAEDQLIEGLFGKTGATGGGLFGSLTGGLGSLFGIGANADGTDDWRGGPTWVGERGPEIVNLPAHAQVVPNGPATNPVAANSNTRDSRPNVIHFNVSTPSPQAFAASQSQIATVLSRAVAHGQRNA